MSPFERRQGRRPDGSTFEIDLIVPPTLTGVDASVAPGPLSQRMLERAHAAIDAWTPIVEDVDGAASRLRSARERRRGEHEVGVDELRPGRQGTSDEDVSRLVEAERLTRSWGVTDTPVTTADIQRIHAVIVGDARPSEWRRDVVWLGDAHGPDPRMRVQPAAPERVSSAMRDLEAFLARPGDPIVIAAIAFAQLPAIHPWRDGNGRTGRLLAQALLARAVPTRSGVAPDASGALAARWGDASVLADAWLTDHRLDEWVAGYCGAIIEASGTQTPSRGVLSRLRRRSGR